MSSLSAPSSMSANALTSSSTRDTSSFPFLTSTPPAVLALVCQHLPLRVLLRLLRSCSDLHRLHANVASFSSAAWSEVALELSLHQRAHQWSMSIPLYKPHKGLIRHKKTDDSDVPDNDDSHKPRTRQQQRGHHIPLSLWQRALPALRYSVEQWDRLKCDWLEKETLRAMLTADQPTKSVRVGAEERVVLSQLTWKQLGDMIPRALPCFRSRFVLAATPHLQHLCLSIDSYTIDPPSAADIFSLVPRLRSLQLEQNDWERIDTESSIISIRAMLALLPSLTSLRCFWLHLAVQDMVHIAAHATLEHIQLEVVAALEDQGVLGDELHFSSKEAAQCDETEQRTDEKEGSEASSIDPSHDISTGKQGKKEAKRHARDIERLPIALTRQTPTRRSIQARLALANWLHRPVTAALRSPDYTPSFRQPTLSLLRYYRQQTATLRSILLEQLASSASDVEDEGSSRESGMQRDCLDEWADTSEQSSEETSEEDEEWYDSEDWDEEEEEEEEGSEAEMSDGS